VAGTLLCNILFNIRKTITSINLKEDEKHMRVSREWQSETSSRRNNLYIEFEYDCLKDMHVSPKVDDNFRLLNEIFVSCSDIIYNQISFSKSTEKALLVFVSGLVNKEEIEYHLLKPLSELYDSSVKIDNLYNFIKDKCITTAVVNEGNAFDELVFSLLSGSILLFVEDSKKAIILDGENIPGRSIETPNSEQTARGPNEAFVENIQDNVVLIRKRLRSPNLVVEKLTVGKRSRTPLALVYLKGVARKNLPEEIIEKIKSIDFDGIIDSAQVEQLIVKHRWTLFPQMLATERPDRIVGSILEGRAALIVNGTPFVLIIPTTFGIFLNSPDDYYGVPVVVSLIRMIRYLGLFVATSVASLYVALTSYHPGLIPTALALSITGTRVGLPFPIIFEVLFMELSLYLVQEAAIRLPKAIAPTIGIVGGLVIGQSVVQAGIASPIIVIIVAASAIASFTIPNYTMSLSVIIIRLFLIICSALLGLYGYVIGQILLLIHAASLENYGVKYLEDYSPFSFNRVKDTFIRAPQHTIFKRPDYLEPVDITRQGINNGKDRQNE
jgi:hypothetical protein